MILHIFFGTKRNADSTSRFLESATVIKSILKCTEQIDTETDFIKKTKGGFFEG